VKIIGLKSAGRSGCYGWRRVDRRLRSALAVSEQWSYRRVRSGVIETNRGVEEFDSRDRALVMRTMVASTGGSPERCRCFVERHRCKDFSWTRIGSCIRRPATSAYAY